MLNFFSKYKKTYIISSQSDTKNSIGETIENEDENFNIQAYAHKNKAKQESKDGGVDYKSKEYIFYTDTNKKLQKGDKIKKDGQQREIEDVLESDGGFIKLKAISNE